MALPSSFMTAQRCPIVNLPGADTPMIAESNDREAPGGLRFFVTSKKSDGRSSAQVNNIERNAPDVCPDPVPPTSIPVPQSSIFMAALRSSLPFRAHGGRTARRARPNKRPPWVPESLLVDRKRRAKTANR
jgi:hypothetical protein